MKGGHFEGFTRSIDSLGRCQVGYYSTKMCREEESSLTLRSTPNLDLVRPMISRPYGKVIKYQLGIQMDQGLFKGDITNWNKLI